jgi:hypothetical protein
MVWFFLSVIFQKNPLSSTIIFQSGGRYVRRPKSQIAKVLYRPKLQIANIMNQPAIPYPVILFSVAHGGERLGRPTAGDGLRWVALSRTRSKPERRVELKSWTGGLAWAARAWRGHCRPSQLGRGHGGRGDGIMNCPSPRRGAWGALGQRGQHLGVGQGSVALGVGVGLGQGSGRRGDQRWSSWWCWLLSRGRQSSLYCWGCCAYWEDEDNREITEFVDWCWCVL